MGYKEPFRDSYFGFPLYYRIETRAEKDTLILSYRDEQAEKSKIIYEHPPRTNKKIREWIANKGTINALPQKTLLDFLHGFVGVDCEDEKQRDENISRRRVLLALPLGMLLHVDKEHILNVSGSLHKPSTNQANERILRIVLQNAGNIPWRDAIPEQFSAWLSDSSEHDRSDVKRVMKHFFAYQCDLGICSDNPWVDFDPETILRKPQNSISLRKHYVEPSMLSEKQCVLIFEKCRERLANKTITGIDVAVLLMLINKLDTDTISAIDLTDFHYLKDFHSRLVLCVTHITFRPKGKKNYRIMEIEDAYKQRTLPTVSLINECWKFLIKKHKLRIGSVSGKKNPLVPSKSNAARRVNPVELEAEITRYIAEIVGIMCQPITGADNSLLPSVISMLQTTAHRKMIDCGFEDEELRVIEGLRPKLVSARSYYDRHNEAALNKMGALQERWVGNTGENEPLYSGTISVGKTKNVFRFGCAIHDCRTQAIIKFSLSDLSSIRFPRGGIELEVTALHGMSGTTLLK